MTRFSTLSSCLFGAVLIVSGTFGKGMWPGAFPAGPSGFPSLFISMAEAAPATTSSQPSPPVPPVIAQGAKVAFLGLTFLDTSTEGAMNGVREDETRRTLMLQDMVRDRFEKEGLTLVDLAPIADELARTVNPSNCYGCEVRMAAKTDASYVVTGLVQKVSNLILSMNLVMREVPSGKIVRARSVDIRSNTDDSWQRGMRYILKNAFFKT
ncbi:DUF3280 domain-containing protein [Roseibium suaedae]|uniref:DUF2380 domain-containing protein n=1 Tax=Roseibium suaedae TaxID=735517 RepID=A0A1M7PPE8_9HYPH|nr:DUF3280 domain-containing protein [Roseibium suaedae]SHN19216.1 Protein of unknown function [Roseibium suaedae]